MKLSKTYMTPLNGWLVCGLAIAHVVAAQVQQFAPLSQSSGAPQASVGNQTLDASSDPSGGAVATSANYTLKPGYVGQLFDVTGVQVESAASPIDEGMTNQLTATAKIDDGTTYLIPAGEVEWSIVFGPIQSISAGGLVQSSSVYQDTLARVSAEWFDGSGTDQWLVLDSDFDNFFPVNGDGVDDSWQFAYFDTSPKDGTLSKAEATIAGPDADPDLDGRDNMMEFLSGYEPDNAASFFEFTITGKDGSGAHFELSKVISMTRYKLHGTTDLTTPQPWPDLGLGFTGIDAVDYTFDDATATSADTFYYLELEDAR